jgi:hypothetical protein
MWDPNDHGTSTMPRSSYKKRAIPPPFEPGAPVLVGAWWNRHWTPYILGALQQLAQPSVWDTDDPALLALTLARVQELISNIGNAAQCDTAAALPIGNGDSAWSWIQSSPNGCYLLGAGPAPAPLANGDAAGTWILNAPGGRYILN